MTKPTVSIGQFAAFYGDRGQEAMQAHLDVGVDFLVGDYLAELTMLVLSKTQQRSGVGYAAGFVDDLAPLLRQISGSGTKVVTNAGGHDPEACARAVREKCAELGVPLTVAWVHGDDVRPQVQHALSDGAALVNMDSGVPYSGGPDSIVTANAYLGIWPIVEALSAGADIVICPRVTDAALAMAPAAYWHGWKRDDWDRLATALVVGHVIECGSQATGGNFSGFLRDGTTGTPGMPRAEVSADGSAVVRSSGGTRGGVTVATVTEQLIYEVKGRLYYNPDVVADLGTVRLEQLDDGVRVADVRGHAPTDQLKVSLSGFGGFRNSVSIGLTGQDIGQKAEWITNQVAEIVGGFDSFDAHDISLVGPAVPGDPGTMTEGMAVLIISVRDEDRSKVGRRLFSDRIAPLITASVPGFFMVAPPQREQGVAVQWPCLIAKSAVRQSFAVGDGALNAVPWGPCTAADELDELAAALVRSAAPAVVPEPGDEIAVPLAEVVGTRSGDKAGMSNLGVYAFSDEGWTWLRHWLTVERIQQLLPETRYLKVERVEFANLRALNFLIHDFLDAGVSSCLRIDAQGKAVGEYLRSKVVPVPVALVGGGALDV
ncbi:DUF1446 domain-containing protein [Dactylosporangium roseum]|uniref:DUF1446 domain-containing protein n=1 Tax=Dactylosporangium roseum TaxID=47989 RepID=A0ABY5Z0T7_9ACTN|nr:acyclic terpene utilization AtuA family protein [Dactylosporangium roseum]UWZ34482.1 DUF1446 domain-containing protein [Dactylosporangium roseum]